MSEPAKATFWPGAATTPVATGAPIPRGADAVVMIEHVRVPDLVIMGSHCTGLDAVVGGLVRQGRWARVLAVGSLGGLTALQRSECDIAPIHLLDPATGAYNRPYLSAGMKLIEGWRRMQGLS